METLTIKGGGASSLSTLHVGESLDNLGNYLSDRQTIIITDTNVSKIYQNRFPIAKTIVIGTGEGNKTLATVEKIYRQMIDFQADRDSFIVAVGGGIVCDIAGFAASTYMRGIEFGFVPTTLLAQVDASVGGKNGVNLEGYKNMVGVFNQPRFVICDPELLISLKREDLLCGFAEIVKHGAIYNAEMFAYIENHWQRALALDLEVIEKLVYDSIVIKAAVVNQDEREAGERRKLNFGHTYGHALEKTTAIPHGEAVSIGMIVAASLSVEKGKLPSAHLKRLKALLGYIGLPVKQPAGVKSETIIEALSKDKKRAGQYLHFILLEELGKAVIKEIAIDELENLIRRGIHS
jgi:3-dehydroquinate synthase